MPTTENQTEASAATNQKAPDLAAALEAMKIDEENFVFVESTNSAIESNDSIIESTTPNQTEASAATNQKATDLDAALEALKTTVENFAESTKTRVEKNDSIIEGLNKLLEKHDADISDDHHHSS